MKLKTLLIVATGLSVLAFSACKSSKQEDYKASYETAKTNKPTVYVIEEVKPAEKAEPIETPQKEKLTTISGPVVNSYSVVIGSFINKTNATSLKDRMEQKGYTPTIAQNEKGMYRVILSTYPNHREADSFKQEIIKKFAPDFFDAWVLEQEK